MINEHREPDPIANLAATLAALDVHATRDARRLRRNENNRIGLLYVHAVAALIIAPMFAAAAPSLTGPSWQFLRLLPWFPYSLAIWLGVAGLILLPSTIARITRPEMIALSMLSVWYTVIAVGFFIPTASWIIEATPAIFSGDELPGHRPGLYAWAVYAHLSVIMRVHLATLWRMRREHRALQ